MRAGDLPTQRKVWVLNLQQSCRTQRCLALHGEGVFLLLVSLVISRASPPPLRRGAKAKSEEGRTPRRSRWLLVGIFGFGW